MTAATINATPRPWRVEAFRSQNPRNAGELLFIRISGPNGEKVADLYPHASVAGVGEAQALANAAMIVEAANRAPP